jgi:hypothetical protein
MIGGGLAARHFKPLQGVTTSVARRSSEAEHCQLFVVKVCQRVQLLSRVVTGRGAPTLRYKVLLRLRMDTSEKLKEVEAIIQQGLSTSLWRMAWQSDSLKFQPR